eukprot:NODE_1649_length_1427_cov_43.895385_g1565_i0.p1 GENE.NODE_1649_length_1427_cov_43.895385_g1565_i0~~NODE_1649_length_1427_cov_43.895385_g1565_i0.p1  ORF type:complete len:428 (+),score=96.52 NODE_1649_length_1427_cov_43.895385_g1565_i0:53-1285(+)
MIDKLPTSERARPSSQIRPASRVGIKCKWCMAVVKECDLEDHLEHTCPLVPLRCGLQNTEFPDDFCDKELKGRGGVITHQEQCPYRTVECQNARCGAMVSKKALKLHYETCPHQSVSCLLCPATFYRVDQDYHSSSCPNAEIECPLMCGQTLKRAQLKAHLKEQMLEHAHSALEAEEQYLPDDHPHMIYAALLKHLKEMRMQLEVARNPSLLAQREYREAIYADEKQGPSHHARPYSLVPGDPSEQGSQHSNGRLNSAPNPKYRPAEHSEPSRHHRHSPLDASRFEDCLALVDSLTGSLIKASARLRDPSLGSSADREYEAARLRSTLTQEHQAVSECTEVFQRRAEGLLEEADPYHDRPGRQLVRTDDGEVTLEELWDQLRTVQQAQKRMEQAWYDLKCDLYDRKWAAR